MYTHEQTRNGLVFRRLAICLLSLVLSRCGVASAPLSVAEFQPDGTKPVRVLQERQRTWTTNSLSGLLTISTAEVEPPEEENAELDCGHSEPQPVRLVVGQALVPIQDCNAAQLSIRFPDRGDRQGVSPTLVLPRVSVTSPPARGGVKPGFGSLMFVSVGCPGCPTLVTGPFSLALDGVVLEADDEVVVEFSYEDHTSGEKQLAVDVTTQKISGVAQGWWNDVVVRIPHLSLSFTVDLTDLVTD